MDQEDKGQGLDSSESLSFRIWTRRIRGFSPCKEIEANWLILDDARARTAAISAGYRVIGLAGILLLAKHQHLIEDIKPLFDELVDKNFRLSDKIMKGILQETGE